MPDTLIKLTVIPDPVQPHDQSPSIFFQTGLAKKDL